MVINRGTSHAACMASFITNFLTELTQGVPPCPFFFNFQYLFSHVRKIRQRNVPPLTFSFNGTQGEEGVE